MSDTIICIILNILTVFAYISVPLLIRYKIDKKPLYNLKARKILAIGLAIVIVLLLIIIDNFNVYEGIPALVSVIASVIACLILYPIITKGNEEISDVRGFTGGCLLSIIIPAALLAGGFYYLTLVPDDSILEKAGIGFMTAAVLGIPGFIVHKMFK